MVKCTLCNKEGHRKNNKKFHPTPITPMRITRLIKTIRPMRIATRVVRDASLVTGGTRVTGCTCVVSPVAHITANTASQSHSMDSRERVRRLTEHLAMSKTKHEDHIMKLSSLKDAHVYCVIHNVSAQQFGSLLERYIRTRFNYTKNKAEDCNGDCSKDGENIEIKVSLGGATHTKFNFVQLRPSHGCDAYILTAYHLNYDNLCSEGELYIFKVSKEEIKKVIMTHGDYAHGTIKEHGSITMDKLNDNASMKEYALRPSFNDACWDALMQYRVSEDEL